MIPYERRWYIDNNNGDISLVLNDGSLSGKTHDEINRYIGDDLVDINRVRVTKSSRESSLWWRRGTFSMLDPSHSGDLFHSSDRYSAYDAVEVMRKLYLGEGCGGYVADLCAGFSMDALIDLILASETVVVKQYGQWRISDGIRLYGLKEADILKWEMSQ